MATPNALRRSQRSHRAILEAALDLCAERGYGNVTVEAIAARAGVSKKTIYRWWPTKGAVVLEALHEWREDAMTFPDTGDIVADLQAQLEIVNEFMTGPRGAAYTGLIAESQHDERLAHALADRFIRPRNEVTLRTTADRTRATSAGPRRRPAAARRAPVRPDPLPNTPPSRTVLAQLHPLPDHRDPRSTTGCRIRRKGRQVNPALSTDCTRTAAPVQQPVTAVGRRAVDQSWRAPRYRRVLRPRPRIPPQGQCHRGAGHTRGGAGTSRDARLPQSEPTTRFSTKDSMSTWCGLDRAASSAKPFLVSQLIFRLECVR